MNHTEQLKHHSQSDDIWFKKTNYPGEWLSKKSKDIINQINQKNMKNLLFTLLLPLLSFSQTYYTDALNFQNNIRSYYNVNSLSHSSDLALEAQMWANHLASVDQILVSSDNYGENIFWADKNYIKDNNKNVLLEASINWILYSDDQSTYNQMIYGNTSNIGFGVAENENSIYVVAKYDKLYE